MGQVSPLEAVTRIVERNGSRCVEVRFAGPLSTLDERFMWAYLAKARGVAYTEVHEQTKRMTGYGVWEREWRSFRFWLEISIIGEDDDSVREKS